MEPGAAESEVIELNSKSTTEKKDFQGNLCHQDQYTKAVSSAGIWNSLPA